MASKSQLKRLKAQRETKTQRVEILCIVDKSGSMASTMADAVGGYNTFLGDQAKQPGEARVTLVLFDTVYRVAYESVPVAKAPKLSLGEREANSVEFQPGGMTALLDAVGKGATELRARIQAQPKSARPDKVVCAIVTDGGENSSCEYTRTSVRKLLDDADKEGWEVVYIGANQDAFHEAGHMGIKLSNTANAVGGAMGMASAFKAASSYTTMSRAYAGKLDAAAPQNLMQTTYDTALADEEAKKTPKTPKS